MEQIQISESLRKSRDRMGFKGNDETKSKDKSRLKSRESLVETEESGDENPSASKKYPSREA